MKKALILVLSCATFHMFAAESSAVQAGREALAKGLAWLSARQQADGHWSDAKFPALTGLPLWAIAASGDSAYASNVTAAVAFVLSKQQPDGGIYVPDPRRGGAGLGNYNTSVCMMALHASGRKDTLNAILKARDYTAATQLTGDDAHSGGYGYDRGGRRRSDLSNSAMAYDAMRMTQDVEDLRPAGSKHADLNWDAALKYVSSMQVKEGDDAGGFLYVKTPPRGFGGNADRPLLQAYGSITYDGLLALVHCNLAKSDPRVRSALEFCTKHWTLDENPGQGGQGVYFYYDILTRALNATGVDTIPLADGTQLDWRSAVILKVASLQKPDGSWVNANNRWWEADPVLATSYSIICLEHALKTAH